MVQIVDYDAIAKILTLRYNPDKPLTKPLTPDDFKSMKVTFKDAESQLLGIIEHELAQIRVKSAAVLLSGGVDSILTLAMLKKFRPDIKLSCVSMGFGDVDDEVPTARKIAEDLECEFDAVVMKHDILYDLPMLIHLIREPRWNLYHYYALESARSRSRTIFCGDGGDELFGGYTFRYQKYASLLPKNARWKEKVQVYLSCHERDWVPDQTNMFGPRVKFSWEKIYAILRGHFDNFLEPLDQVFLADYCGKLLCEWMPENAVFSRALDARITSLFCSRRMVKFAAHLPWKLKYCPSNATGKLLLRSLLKKQDLMAEPVKRGFSIDTAALWHRGGQEIVQHYVNTDSAVVKAGVIRGDWVEKTYARLKADLDVRYVNKMLGVLALEIWWRLFVSLNMKKTDKL